MIEITTRTATAQDYDDLCRIIDQVDALHRENVPHVFRKPDGPVRERTYILGLLADTDHGLFVAEVEGQVAGFVHVTVWDTPPIPILVPRRLAIVDNLAVSRDQRRLGIGRALMQEAQRWAIEQGAAEIELNVFEFNQPAMAFYQSLGYETLRRRMGRRLG
jgi:ribosomal protein S18 acetylase RimI-like enzyme